MVFFRMTSQTHAMSWGSQLGLRLDLCVSSQAPPYRPNMLTSGPEKKKKEKISWRYQIAKLELVNKPMGDVALGLHLFSPNSPLFLAMLAEGPLGW